MKLSDLDDLETLARETMLSAGLAARTDLAEKALALVDELRKLLAPAEGIDLDEVARDLHGLAAHDAHLASWARATVPALVAAILEARAWVRSLTASERVLTCAFCGEAYPPGTPETNHERLTAHVKVCPKHPMREVERKLAAAQSVREVWRGVADDLGAEIDRITDFLGLPRATMPLDAVMALRTGAEKAEAEIANLLASAVPHPTEHPTMFAAWKRARAFLARDGAERREQARDEKASTAGATLERVAQLLGPVGTPFASMQRVKRARELLAAALGRVGSTSASACCGSGLAGPLRRGIYIASKTVHASRWRDLRAKGAPIISTWIDEAEAGETKDRADLWTRCIREAASASALILYRADASEEVKGALAEAGAALAAGVPVWWVGPVHTLSDSIYTMVEHPLVRRGSTLEEAFEAAGALAGEAPQ